MRWPRAQGSFAILVAGYVLLYAPMLMLVVFSFNHARLGSVWTGFSLRWYQELLQNAHVAQALWTSLWIASVSATLATLLGTLTAVVWVRSPYKSIRTWIHSTVLGPLVMPDVIMGIALLLLFVGMEKLWGWPPQRGAFTIVMAHISLALSYVAVLVRAQLLQQDRALEEAALDLGASPHKVFGLITLPMIVPTLVASWLLAFALSFDDVVLASFLSGAQTVTLPMLVLSYVRHGLCPLMNALATLMILVLSLGLVAGAYLILKFPKARLQFLPH